MYSEELQRLIFQPKILKKMKINIFSLILILTTLTNASAQISIGGKQAVEGASTILDFNSTVEGKKSTDTSVNNTDGIILSSLKLSDIPTLSAANNGTFIFDTQAQVVKMYENNVWKDLTAAGNSSSVISNSSAESADPQGVIVGSSTSSAVGALILEAPDKALVLPRITDPHLKVKSPYPGMMCYDVTSKSLAVFDGVLWHYWK